MRATKALLDRAELRAPRRGAVLNHDGGVADDRADVQFVVERHVPVGRAPDSFRVGRNAAETGISREARTAAADEIEHPGPVLIREMLVGRGLTHFGKEIVGPETAAERNGHAMLGKHVQGRVEAAAAFDLFP